MHRQALQLVDLLMNPGGPPTPDKPNISVVNYEVGNTVSSFMNLRVADIQACYEEWSSKGAEFVTPPIDRGAEIRCYMRDPDGYMIEVGQATGVLLATLAKKRPEDLPGDLGPPCRCRPGAARGTLAVSRTLRESSGRVRTAGSAAVRAHDRWAISGPLFRVTRGQPGLRGTARMNLVCAPGSGNRCTSQADSASSILVTRSSSFFAGQRRSCGAAGILSLTVVDLPCH